MQLMGLLLITCITDQSGAYLLLEYEQMEEEALKSKLSSQLSLYLRQAISWAGSLVVWITARDGTYAMT